MDSPNRPRSLEVDQLRGAASLLVLFYHSTHSGNLALGLTAWPKAQFGIDALLYEGHTGVALFMVLSGYILSSGTFDSRINYAQFLRNRLLRIFPLMIVVFVFAVYSTHSLNLGKIASTFFLMSNTSAAFSDPAGLNGTFWTIAVEFQFYLVAPFLFAFIGRHGLLYLLGVGLLFWLLRIIVLIPHATEPIEMYKISYFSIVGRINQFMIGIGLAYLFHLKLLKRHRSWLALLSLTVSVQLILLAATALNRDGGIAFWQNWRVIYPEVEGLLWASFIAAYLSVRPLGESVLGRCLYWLGQISFSMYILHYAIQREWWLILYPRYFSDLITRRIETVPVTIIIAAIVVFISWLSYRCIEKPFQDMRGSYLDLDDSRAARAL